MTHDESSLPDATPSTVLVHVKPKATAASKVGSGNLARCGTKAAKVKQQDPKKKVRVDSELEDGVVRWQSGRTWGAINWSNEDFTALLDAIDNLLPAGNKAWAGVYSCFKAWEKEQGHPLHLEATIENKYEAVSALGYELEHAEANLRIQLVYISMLTGDADYHLESQHVHHLEHLISNHVASGTVWDDDLDNEVMDISSDNSPRVGTKWKWITNHIKMEPLSEPKVCTSKVDL